MILVKFLELYYILIRLMREVTKSYINSFNSQEFYDWAFEMAKTNIVIISSYSISDERFEAVCSFDKARSTLQNGTSNNRKN